MVSGDTSIPRTRVVLGEKGVSLLQAVGLFRKRKHPEISQMWVPPRRVWISSPQEPHLISPGSPPIWWEYHFTAAAEQGLRAGAGAELFFPQLQLKGWGRSNRSQECPLGTADLGCWFGLSQERRVRSMLCLGISRGRTAMPTDKCQEGCHSSVCANGTHSWTGLTQGMTYSHLLLISSGGC